jgi:hypothetical protein
MVVAVKALSLTTFGVFPEKGNTSNGIIDPGAESRKTLPPEPSTRHERDAIG